MSWMDDGGFVMNLLPHRRHLDGGPLIEMRFSTSNVSDANETESSRK